VTLKVGFRYGGVSQTVSSEFGLCIEPEPLSLVDFKRESPIAATVPPGLFVAGASAP
jgi:hypothetical protein